MKLLSVVSCSVVLAGAIAAATAGQPAAKINPLRVSLTAAPAANGGFLGAVEVTITNTSNHTVRVPKWELPSDFMEAKLFQVSRDGQPVQYEGPMIKRGLPRAEDFAILRAGETLRTVVDLSGTYDMSKSGDYIVTLSSPLQHASLSSGEMLKNANGLPMTIQSVPLRLWVDGSDLLDAKGSKRPGSGGTVVNGVTYVGCSTTQINDAGNAVVEARKYSENGKGYLATGAVGARYTTWFGAYTSSRYSTANQHFVSIDAALDQNAGQVTINCGCNQSYYAYVYPTQPYQIYVCRAFWTAPLTGTDSKAGTLIHETSHFNVVAGTDDHVYGQSGAKNLAITNPDAALDNADNHEYFAENNPFQN
ncbi:MAG TPA: M35 family metallo-endopeptidase [Lysobacter sp.]|jgi:peptidyl-Lys metalloendopeptidase|nr:M35 family metallo-endopeptidase [Lysobacter sp.]